MSTGGIRRGVALGVAALSVMAVTAIAAVTVAPGEAFASTNACGYGSTNGNVRTCVLMSGTSVSTSAQVKDEGRTLNSCLHRNGVRLGCTGYSYVARGHGTGLNWIPGGHIPNGTYCAVTWRKNPNGTTTELASECVGIGVTQVG
jgi:hypothetical protein